MFGLKSLEVMHLVHDNLSGTFTVAGTSPNLVSLFLNVNKLTGYFVENWCCIFLKREILTLLIEINMGLKSRCFGLFS